jgi:cob(I)alamin adenosyltransferase
MGLIYVFTGDGQGKTSASLGLALRSLGYGKNVVMIQFLKGRKTGEILIKKFLPNFEVYQFGRKGFIDLKNPSEEDINLARKGLAFAKKILERTNKPYLLVLDEICLAVKYGILDLKNILDFLKILPKETNLVLTGSFCPPEIIEKADLVTKMTKVKHPYDRGKKARRGLDY